MPRRKSSDSPIGHIITDRLEEMERSQAWLARKVHRSIVSISRIVKGSLKPSVELVELIASELSISTNILTAVLEEKDEK